jgi:hypothetical protein
MKNLNTVLVVPNVSRFQVVRAHFDPDAVVPVGEIEIRFLMVGGNSYGPNGTNGTWVVPIIDTAGGGRLAKNAAPTGAGDAIVTQPNPNTGVFTACWNAWRSAPNTKKGRNNALEAIIDTPAIGILSAELAGT